MKANMHL